MRLTEEAVDKSLDTSFSRISAWCRIQEPVLPGGLAFAGAGRWHAGEPDPDGCSGIALGAQMGSLNLAPGSGTPTDLHNLITVQHLGLSVTPFVAVLYSNYCTVQHLCNYCTAPDAPITAPGLISPTLCGPQRT